MTRTMTKENRQLLLTDAVSFFGENKMEEIRMFNSVVLLHLRLLILIQF